jgi:hypothetical protein
MPVFMCDGHGRSAPEKKGSFIDDEEAGRRYRPAVNVDRETT